MSAHMHMDMHDDRSEITQILWAHASQAMKEPCHLVATCHTQFMRAHTTFALQLSDRQNGSFTQHSLRTAPLTPKLAPWLPAHAPLLSRVVSELVWASILEDTASANEHWSKAISIHALHPVQSAFPLSWAVHGPVNL